jgi:hypothetical protein
MRNILIKSGLEKLAEHERHLKFFNKNKRTGMVVVVTRIKEIISRRRFISKAVRYYPALIKNNSKERYLASKLKAFLDDMQFNLEPKADVYARADKREEEAIACIEALARVPQQACKWGHLTAKIAMPNLYQIYYQQVIPACIETYQNLTGNAYSVNMVKQHKTIISSVKALFKKKVTSAAIWEF